MRKPGRHWFGAVRRKLFRSSPKETVVVFHTNTTTSFTGEATPRDSQGRNDVAFPPSDQKKELIEQDLAAVRIQSFFRGHLARRAFRALRSLVRLQALVRGACVRRQARIALHCMHALARLQIAVRARQLLAGGSSSDSFDRCIPP
ncbi:hypothetical protein NMG60_11026362 [Bertholletia excelsa]